MFGLFSSKPPLSTRQRAELEWLMRESVLQLGATTLREAEVIGQLSDLQLDLSDPESLLMTAATEVRRRMKLTAENVATEISNEQTIGGEACYQNGSPPTIQIAIETLQDPLRTITALADQFAVHLYASAESVKQAPENELLNDLIPLCYGFGVLQSDASLYFSNWSMGEWSGYRASRSGYLNAQEIGYALALFARVRGEENPPWKRWLRADSAVTLKAAMKYFDAIDRKGGQLLFDAERIPGSESTPRELANWVGGDQPTFALAAAWRLCALDRFDIAIIEALHQATHSDDPDLVPVVIGLLAGADERDQWTIDRVGKLLRDRRPPVALAAAKAATALGMGLKEHLGLLAWLLEKYQHRPEQVLQIIAAQGSAAAGLDVNLARMLPRSIKSIDDETTVSLLDCLAKISNSPQQAIESVISPGPLRDEATRWLQRVQ